MSSKTKNILILLAALLISGFIILWIQVINKGTLIVAASPPFTINISPMGGTHECLNDSCSYKIKPGDFNITLQKSGFFEEEIKAKVFIFKETNIKGNLVKIPELNKIETLNLPVLPEIILNARHNLEYKSAFLKADGLNKIIAEAKSFKALKNVAVSNFGEWFLLEGSTGKVYLYGSRGNVDGVELKDLNGTIYKWGASDKFIYYAKDNEERQLIYRYDVATGKSELLTSFLRKIENIDFYASPDDKFVTISENSGNLADGNEGDNTAVDAQNDTAVYLLDTANLRKERIMLLPNLQNFKWSPDASYAVYQVTSAADELPIIYIYSRKDNNSRETRIPMGVGLIEWMKNDEFAFVSSIVMENYLRQEDVNSFALFSEKFRLASDGINILDQDIVMSYDVTADEWRNITTNSRYVLRITDLRVGADLSVVYIVSEGILYGLGLM
ncbi:hypothetical protein KKG71_02545 [Patescibacteria group bacterium]|nr:hypothetical protein [Patescibacteria group bacterium]